MDSSEHRTISNLPLDRLVAHALGELEKLRYSRRSLRRYRTVWEHLVRFAREMNLGDQYSEHLAMRFVDAHWLQNDEHSEMKEEWRRHIPLLGHGAGRVCPRRPRRARSHRLLEMKRRALEKVADDAPLPKMPSWTQNKTLLEWLHSL